NIQNPATGDFAGELDVLEIKNILPPFSFAEESLPLLIQAGDNQNVELVFSPQSIDEFSNEIQLLSNAGTIALSLSGAGTPPAIIDVQPDAILSNLDIGQSETQTLEISNQGQADLDLSLQLRRAAGNDQQRQPAQVAAAARLTPFNPLNQQAAILFQQSKNHNAGEIDELVNVSAEASVYIIDDGSGESNLGFNADFEFMWLNAFRTVAGAEIITSISSALANGPQEGVAAKFILYDDPNDDGNPADAVFLTEVTTVLENPGTDMFTTALIEPTRVKGVFFVAVLVQEDANDRAFPAPLDDNSASLGASWVIGNEGVGGFDSADLANNSFGPLLVDDAGFPGNWLLRADGLFFGVKPITATIGSGASRPFEVEILGNVPGSQRGEILISSNDPNRPELIVPLNLQVGNVDFDVRVAPLSLADTLPQGAESQTFFTIQNNSNTAINYAINITEDQGISLSPLMNLVPPQDAQARAITRPEPRQLSSQTVPIIGGRDQLTSPLLETGFESPDYVLGDLDEQQDWFRTGDGPSLGILGRDKIHEGGKADSLIF
ncbi:MAG: hypothetical protein AAFU64_10945, partial [Bacteroidota bacterium]